MKRETLKEGLDLSKIVFAVAILPMTLKNGPINGYALLGALAFAIGDIMLINKGVDNE